jgi:dipeptidyl aminopeptidase/acylaminoacyl peptidase
MMNMIKGKKVFLMALILGSVQVVAINLKLSYVPTPPLTPPIPARSGSQTITPDWLLKNTIKYYSTPYSVSWLDSKHLVYTLPPILDHQTTIIQLFDLNTNSHKQLAPGSEPLPSPDGRWIAFINGENAQRQLWLMDINGNNLKQVTKIPSGLNGYNSSFAWSADSQFIAVANQATNLASNLLIKSNQTQPNSFNFMHNPPPSEIDIYAISTLQPRKLATIDAAVRRLSWAPDGKSILFMEERRAEDYHTYFDYTAVQTINLSNDRQTAIVEFDGMQQFLNPCFSPDGKQIAFLYDSQHPVYSYSLDVGLTSLDSNQHKISSIKPLTHEIKIWKAQWSVDQSRIYALRDYGMYRQLYTLNSRTGEAQQITNEPLQIQEFSLSPDGQQVAWVGLDPQGAQSFWIANKNGTNRQELVKVASAPTDMALSEIREIAWQPPTYPEKIRGALILPLNYQPGTLYPLIVDIHGGGPGTHIFLYGGMLVSSPLEWQLWAAKGYAVFIPEYRSSGAFGSLAINRDIFQNHDILNQDGIDVTSGIDYLIHEGIGDKNRIALLGFSAGAIRVNWLTAATHEYQAIISKDGLADNYYLHALNTPPTARLEIPMGGSPHEVPQNYLKNSALAHAVGATTPTLFLMGNPQLGGLDDMFTSRLLYGALSAQGIETQYVYYPDEGHGLIKPKNIKDALIRTINWIDNRSTPH